MTHIARHSRASWLTIKEIAAKENYPVAYIEKILQALRHAGLVVSHAGNHGGYELARKQSDITLKEIIDALEGSTFETFCEPAVREDIVCTHFCLCGIKPVWRRTKQILDDFYGSITLEMLTKNEIEIRSLMPEAGAAKGSAA
jgi:Rrf2 family protein